MGKFLDFIENHKFGIIAALGSAIGMYVYFQMQNYEAASSIVSWDKAATIEKVEIEIKPENIEQIPINTNAASGDIKSIAKNLNDERETSNENWDRNKSSSVSTAQNIKELEKQYYAQTGESEKRDAIRKQLEDLRKQEKKENTTSSTNKSDNPSNGGNTAFKGKTMVAYSLRDPHQNNEWWVRNPGYTCGYGSNGEVYIKIKVNQNGTVVSATYIPEKSYNASSCMIEQAKKYALMSRFVYANTALQEGNITYTFLAQ